MLVEKSITTEGLREDTWSVLESIAREGARKVLQQALEIEVAEYIEAHAGEKDGRGHRRVVRNGSMPERDILTGMGPISIRQPRVDDRR
jgi:transposase-like protein